jgi:ferredoxin
MGCPFTLPRTLARRLSKSGGRWPRRLRNKWLAIAGLFGFFLAYEVFDLWASPLLTAWVAVSYFALSFILEAAFTESPFCKYVCPLGTFNFAYSTASPLQIRAKDPTVCHSCVGKECLNGSYSEQPVIRIDQITDGVPVRTHTLDQRGVLGCGTLLYVPQIKSNWDCTLCLDCARACPHDNVALAPRRPFAELIDVRAWPKRYDLAFLAYALTFMGLSNAVGMTPPLNTVIRAISTATGLVNEPLLLLIVIGCLSLVLPALLTGLAAQMSLRLGGTSKRGAFRLTYTHFAPAFIPLGLGIWVGHYAYHFITGGLLIIPIFQNFLNDNGLYVGPVTWDVMANNTAALPIVGLIQLVGVVGGFIGSAWIAQKIAFTLYRKQESGFKAWLPWFFLLLTLTMVAYWVFALPMEMRGALTG